MESAQAPQSSHSQYDFISGFSWQYKAFQTFIYRI
jgi:hypothetical protein